MFWTEIWKISDFFLSENFPFLVVKFSIYLNMRVFVMHTPVTSNKWNFDLQLCRENVSYPFLVLVVRIEYFQLKSNNISQLNTWRGMSVIAPFFAFYCVQSTLIIPTLDVATKFVIMTIWLSRKPSLKRWQLIRNYAVALLFNTSINICFGYLLESPHRGDSNKYPKHMVYTKIKLNMAFVAYHYSHWELFTTTNSF